MIELTTLSWYTFFVVLSILVGIWFLTVRTRLGRLIIERETPWTVEQWVRLLVVILATVFILVNPIFHLLTLTIVAVLYYILVAKNFLSKNLMEISKAREALPFLSLDYDRIKFTCKHKEESDLLAHKRLLERCLFSFPVISGNEPEIKYENELYHVELNLSSDKYTSSLFSYIDKAGFQIIKNETK